MNIPSKPVYEYYFGGTMWGDDPTYVTRQADHNFYEGLKAGNFCYVLNSRQMGKSSLRVRTMQRFQSEGIACAAFEITKIIGNDTTEETWYTGLIQALVDSFELDFNLNDWWEERRLLSYVQRFSTFIETIVLAQADQQFVIFIDEIDSILKLGFSTDDFFAYIRSCWNDRADKPAYRRLAFAILGVATPADLVQDKRRTPFNIGRAIELTGFSFAEAQPLLPGLTAQAADPAAVLQEILRWTGGQPFLTQKVCQAITEVAEPIALGQEVESVAAVIRDQVIENWEQHDDPEHLRTIRNRIIENTKNQAGRLLGIYQQILTTGEIDNDNSPEQMELRLTGLVVKADNKLMVYNRVYREVFDRAWLDQVLRGLRPYAEAFNAWVVSGYGDESRLLRGQTLQDALVWAGERSLGAEDYRFLSASQTWDTRETLAALEKEKQANEILAAAKQEAESSLTVARGQVEALHEQEVQAQARLVKTERRVKLGSYFLAAIMIATVGVGFWLKKSIDSLNLATMRLARMESKTASANNQSLEAMIQAVRAGKSLRNLDQSTGTKDDRFQTITSLQQAYKGVLLEQHRLTSHASIVNSTSFSPDGSKIVTASDDKTVRVWDVRGQLMATLSGHSSIVNSASFSPDGSKIVTASDDKTVRVWDVRGQLLATLSGHSASVNSASFSPDGSKIVTASSDKTARVWDVRGQLLATLSGHSSIVNSASFSPDGNKIVTASHNNIFQSSSDKTARVWDVRGHLLATLSGHSASVNSASFSPDSSKIVTASYDKTARVWDARGQLLATLTGHSSIVNSASFSPDGGKIVTASSDKTARVWDVRGQLLATFTSYLSTVNSASFSPDGSKIVTVSDDKTARVWGVRGQLLATLAGHSEHVNSASFSPDGSKIVTASDDKTARVWDVREQLLATLSGHSSTVYSASFSPDGSKIVTASSDKTARVWDVQGQLLATLSGHSSTVYSASFSPDGSKIVTSSYDKTARVWDLRGQLLATLSGHSSTVYSASFSPDDNKIVTVSDDKTARVWDVRGQLLATLSGHSERVNSASFSPDGSKIVTVSDDKTARVWGVRGQLLDTLTGHSSTAYSVSFSPDGSKIVTASYDKTARVWDVQGQLMATLSGHSAKVYSASFSPDGSKIVTASDDDTARVWDVRGQLLTTLTGHSARVYSASFSPDGSKIVTASDDKTARVWDRIDTLESDLDRLLSRSCQKLHDYLATDPTVKPEDRELCGIKVNPASEPANISQ
jgi:WD40 repeat protein